MFDVLNLSNVTLVALTKLLLVFAAICIFVIYILGKGVSSLDKRMENIEETLSQLSPAITEINIILSALLKISGIEKSSLVKNKKEVDDVN